MRTRGRFRSWRGCVPRRTDGFHIIVAHGITTSHTEAPLRIYNGQYQVGSWDLPIQDHKTSSPILAGDVGQWVHLCGVYDGANWILCRSGVEAARTPSAQRVDDVWAYNPLPAPGGSPLTG